jgi:menaquinone-dependent protoporphyrinogen oxidase
VKNKMRDQKQILIAYGSRYGCTEEISNKIAEYLEKDRGYYTKLLNLRRKENRTLIEEFDGVIIGTGIRVGKWTKETTSFLKKCTQIKNPIKPIIGVFISCGYASDPKYYPSAIQDFLLNILDDFGIKSLIDIYDAFGGVFDYSNTSKLNRIDKRILKLGARDLCMNIDYTKKNDYRNWNRIYDFSSRFAVMVDQN